MSGTSSPTGALPPETAERVHAYLAAFLSPPAADEAHAEVLEDVTFWGDLDPVQVFASAHRALSSRLRISTDVEVLVLAEDAEVPVDEIAQVLEIAPTEVRAMLDEALAELAEPDEIPEPRAPRQPDPEPAPAPATSEDGPSSDWPPALVADEPEPEPAPEPVRPEPIASTREPAATPSSTAQVPAEDASDAEEPGTEAAIAPATTSSRSALRDATARATDETATGPAATDAAAPSREAEAIPARRWVTPLLVLGSILLVAIVVASLAGGEDDPTTAGIEASCEDAPICVTQAVLTDSVNSQGVPGEARESFTLDDDVKLWFSFDRNREGPVSLEVRWYRDANELYRSDFRLAAVDRISLTLAGLFMEQPGSYKVEVVGDGQVLLERTFTVTGQGGAS